MNSKIRKPYVKNLIIDGQTDQNHEGNFVVFPTPAQSFQIQNHEDNPIQVWLNDLDESWTLYGNTTQCFNLHEFTTNRIAFSNIDSGAPDTHITIIAGVE